MSNARCVHVGPQCLTGMAWCDGKDGPVIIYYTYHGHADVFTPELVKCFRVFVLTWCEGHCGNLGMDPRILPNHPRLRRIAEHLHGPALGCLTSLAGPEQENAGYVLDGRRRSDIRSAYPTISCCTTSIPRTSSSV